MLFHFVLCRSLQNLANLPRFSVLQINQALVPKAFGPGDGAARQKFDITFPHIFKLAPPMTEMATLHMSKISY